MPEAPIRLLFNSVLLSTGIAITAIAGWYLAAGFLGSVSPDAAGMAVAEASEETDLEDEREREPDGDGILIRTRRSGGHHVVQGALSGPNGQVVAVELLVDTGATVIVLPESLLVPLGFEDADLEPGRAQTARGVVRTKNGRLDRVAIGSESSAAERGDVPVAFVHDRYIGGMALLGMSFLGQFQIMIDDRADEITLIERE